ncbi:putative mitogen-activated protein kinase [Helianthus annuus]|nr:putative mitogen-activated protein kinase [Helianthus annuus]KAJ0942439.1 putative mitogen-activated protein kinase [Helianthus annuus]
MMVAQANSRLEGYRLLFTSKHSVMLYGLNLMLVRNDKARKYLTDMRRKTPVSFPEKFLQADPLALKLLQRLLAFDPKDRPTAEQALADPYFKGLLKVKREPSCQAFSK